MEKLPGVESATVRLKDGRATIHLRPGNTLTLTEIRQRVERSGFTPREAVVRGEAEVVVRGDSLQLAITGTADRYTVTSAPQAGDVLQQLRKHAGQRVVIDGTVPPSKERTETPVIQVTRVEAIAR